MPEINKEGYFELAGKTKWLIKAKHGHQGYADIGKTMLVTNEDYIGKVISLKIEIVDDYNKKDVEDLLKVAKQQIEFTDKQIDEMEKNK